MQGLRPVGRRTWDQRKRSASLTRVRPVGQSLQGTTWRDGEQFADGRTGRVDRRAVGARFRDDQEHVADPAVAHLQGKSPGLSLEVPDPGLGLHRQRVSSGGAGFEPFDPTVPRAQVTRDRERYLCPEQEVWRKAIAKPTDEVDLVRDHGLDDQRGRRGVAGRVPRPHRSGRGEAPTSTERARAPPETAGTPRYRRPCRHRRGKDQPLIEPFAGRESVARYPPARFACSDRQPVREMARRREPQADPLSGDHPANPVLHRATSGAIDPGPAATCSPGIG